jgi:MFS superfamily sulfate permease-like transporter
LADTSVLSNLCGASAGSVDPNQEMVGLGAANLAAGFFQGFPISSSLRAHLWPKRRAPDPAHGVVGALAIAKR